ncbi:hypothetical protein ISCGN_007060 [Ixodes scapularis]
MGRPQIAGTPAAQAKSTAFRHRRSPACRGRPGLAGTSSRHARRSAHFCRQRAPAQTRSCDCSLTTASCRRLVTESEAPRGPMGAASSGLGGSSCYRRSCPHRSSPCRAHGWSLPPQ